MGLSVRTTGSLVLLAAFAACQPSSKDSGKMEKNVKPPDLRSTLETKAGESVNKVPAEKKKIMLDAIESLRATGIQEQALQVGDQIPSVRLPGVRGETVDLNALAAKGPVVLTFYRGSWCPYCNLTLQAYQQSLPAFKELGAEMVAISPDKPDNSLDAKEKNNLEFFVLSDAGNEVAKSFGLVYKLPDDLKSVYLDFGIDLERATGTESWELPLSATYVIAKGGEIKYAYLEEDYKKRAQPADLVQALKSL